MREPRFEDQGLGMSDSLACWAPIRQPHVRALRLDTDWRAAFPAGFSCAAVDVAPLRLITSRFAAIADVGRDRRVEHRDVRLQQPPRGLKDATQPIVVDV